MTATPNYWSQDGTFDVANVAANYVNAANFIQGFNATPPLVGTQPGVFSQMSTAVKRKHSTGACFGVL